MEATCSAETSVCSVKILTNDIKTNTIVTAMDPVVEFINFV